MTPERWHEVKAILNVALEQEPQERAAFIGKACAGDESLRKELESLIASDEQAGSFIEEPAIESLAEIITEKGESLVGCALGSYQVQALIGAGGMGEVYLAEDTRLGRRIALKLLPAHFSGDKDRLHRFQQEARAASALNHPNIITIHEIGQVDDRHFMATEFIDGETLRQRMTAGRLELSEALDISVQVASALLAAHAAGIVHRDIKPENIMIRRDGFVKVLDFGLVKLTEKRTTESEASTLVNTAAGVVMGTAQYMSPEQTRGLEVDARTDIWSLGVVLYEMLAGHAPFEGDTPSDVFSLILQREPPPLVYYSSKVPPELERIIRKALDKDREERYQTAKDFLIDLKTLRRELQFKAELERSASPNSSEEAVAATRSGQAVVNTTKHSAAQTNQEEEARPKSSAEYIVTEIKRHKRGIISAAVMLLIVTIGGGYVLYRFRQFGQTPQTFAPSSSMTITRLTNNGKGTAAAISADGNYVVYGLEDGGKVSLWLRQVKSTSEKEIIAPQEMNLVGLTFSHDGNSIYYTASPKSVLGNVTFHGVVYQVPTLGGTPHKIVENVNGPVALSADGQRLAFIRTSEGAPHLDALIVANPDGTGERQLTTKRDKAYLDPNPTWSPDGKSILCGSGVEPDYFYESILQVSVEDGTERWLTAHKWFQVSRLAWLTDGSGLIAVAQEMLGRPSQIWHVSYPGGNVGRISHDLNGYGSNEALSASLSLTADSRALVVVQHDSTSRMWVTALGEDESRARQISNGKFDGQQGVSWTPDGQILCGLVSDDNPDIWLMKPDGTERKQLTTDAYYEAWPKMSPDGRYIVFSSLRTGYFNIWRIDADGSNPKQLTDGFSTTIAPNFSPDGQSLVLTSNRWTGSLMLGRVSIEGGEPVQLTTYLSFWPVFSPDGRLIAAGFTDQKDNKVRLAIIPAAGGQPLKVFDFPSDPVTNAGVGWTIDGKALTYVDTENGVSNIWSQPITGGPPKQLTRFRSDIICAFALSPDGRQLVLARGTESKDVVLIRDFR